MKKPTLKSILTFLIGWPLSFFALYFIFTRVFTERENLFANLHTLSPLPFVLGIILFLSYFYLRSAVWFVLLRSFNYPLDYKESTSLWAVTQLKRYIPGSIWSFLGLTVLLNKKGIEKKHVFQAILFEQQLVIIAGLSISLLALPYFLTHFLSTVPKVTAVVFVIGVLLIAVLFIFNKKVLFYFKHKLFSYFGHILPTYPPKRIVELILLLALSFFVLGAGYYFVFLSVTFISPELFLQIVGIAIFSLLIGFISVIVPTGLGIREGAFALILSKTVPFATGGLVALLARVGLIIAELIFVACAVLWYRLQSKRIVAFEKYIIRHIHLVTVLLATGIFIWYFSYAGFLRYDNFYTGRFDLGNMVQTVWNTMNGNIFMFTDPNGTREVSRLAFHADFLLLLLTPFYFLWENPKMILLIQVLVVAMGSIFIYLLSRDLLKSKNIAVILALAYLLNPAIQWTLLYDFHAVVLATTFLLGCWYFLTKKQYLPFALFAILAGISKEQVWFVVAILGMYILFFQKKVLIGITTVVGAGFLFYFLLWHAIPGAAGSTSHFALEYYKDGGDSPSSLITNTLLNPVDTAIKLTEKERLLYIRQLLEPLGYLSLLSPFYLIFAAGDIGINLISDKAHLHQIYYQYSAIITPFIFISTLYGIKRLRKKFPVVPITGIGIYILVMTLYASYQYGPLPGSKQQNIGMFTKSQPDREKIAAILKTIPEEKSVAATNNLGPQLSHRREVFVVPLATESADVVTFLFTEQDTKKDSRVNRIYQSVLANPQYAPVLQIGRFFLFEKK